MIQNGDDNRMRNTFSPGPPLLAQQWQVPPMLPAQQNPLVNILPQEAIIRPSEKMYTCERLCGFASPSYQSVVEHERTCAHGLERASGQAYGNGNASSAVEVVMQLSQSPSDMEKNSMRRVIARRCFVPETSVTITESWAQSGHPQVTICVNGSPLPPGARDAALDPANLMQEVNTEASQQTFPMMMAQNPVVMSQYQPTAQLGFRQFFDPPKQSVVPDATNSAFEQKHFDIKRKMKDLELHVVVVEALHLPKKDEWGSSDAFVVVKLGSLKSFETHVLKNSLSPHWEEGGSFELETMTLQNLPPLELEIWDWDRASDNDLIGVGQISPQTIRELITNKEEGAILEETVHISSNGEQVKGKDGLDLYIKIELMIFTKDTPEKQAVEEIKQANDDFHNWIWKSCAGSAYGAFISIAMAQGFLQAVKQAGVMLILTMLIQLTFATQIEWSIEALQEAKGICAPDISIYWASLTVYIVYMFENLPNLFQSIVLVMFSREHERAGYRQRIDMSSPARLLVACTAIFTEAAAWGVQMNAGIRFIVTANGVIAAVRSTVALMFIQGLDEGIFRVCSTPKLRRAVETRKYRVFYGAVFNSCTSEQTIFTLKNYYSQYVHMPLMALVAFCGIMIVRLVLSEACIAAEVPAYVFPWDQPPTIEK